MSRLIAFLMILLSTNAWAGDTHQDGQGHKIVYTITDASGNPVSGITVRLAVERASDEAFLDFSDNTFKTSGWTSRTATMPYNVVGEFYSRVVTIDQATLVSGDYVLIVSNDDTIYADMQAEVVDFDITNNLIRIQR